jgi:exonuclease SbcC
MMHKSAAPWSKRHSNLSTIILHNQREFFPEPINAMNKKTRTVNLGNRQAILDEINALLEASSGINEMRAKKVRKAIESLRNTDSEPAAGEDQSATDPPGEAQRAEARPAEDSELDAKIDAGLEILRTRIHAQVERRNNDYEKSLTLTDELETALKDNELQKAERAYHKLMSIMGNIPGLSEQRWQDIDKRLNRVRPQLRKLESWRHWGTTLARKDLIEQVRQLTEAGLHPEKLAAQIKQAREQWHAWDKSGDHAGKELWKEFDQTCEETYKPCIAHFEKLKQGRKENLRQRRDIIDRLKTLYAETDWQQPDWREIDKTISHARRDFYKIGNVDFKYRKPLARALDEALEKFEENLSSERERSLKVREKLIADIEALAEVANLRDTLDQLDTLKKKWAVTVTSKRELENRLWKRFQAACESIYRRRDAERKEQDAERNENLKQKQALIEELGHFAAAGDAELLANASALARIRHQWETIGWIPRKHESSLDNSWRAAQKQFSSALKAAKSRARDSELDNLARRAALCHQWEQAALAGSAIDMDSIKAEWDALPALSAVNAGTMDQRFGQALSRPDDTTLSNNHAAKRTACLKLEVLLELESPQECQAERMAYQIERLNASLKKELDAQDSPEDLLLAVFATGAVPAEAAGPIEQRISECLARYKSNT